MQLRLRFLLAQVIDPHYHREDALDNMQELVQLVATYGGEVAGKLVQHRVKPDPATYVGRGKLAALMNRVEEEKIDVVVLNASVNSGQLFRLEKALWEVNPRIGVWDRVDLILAIFEQHATTVEAKLQIELARIDHMGPRIYGLGRTALSRQGGGIGTRGLGETNIELERRQLKDRKRQLEKRLEQLSRQKRQRIRWRGELGLGPVALVGYTSAGKTTLFNRLTGKEKKVRAGLFTTLDTIVGRMKTADSRVPVVVSDTIGFIEDLPPMLVEAFRSTLMESVEAKLLLHVVDGADENRIRKMKVVDKILAELGKAEALVVVNKADLMTKREREEWEKRAKEEMAVLVSAKTGEGLEVLKQAVMERLAGENGEK